MDRPTLTAHQQEKLDWIVARLVNDRVAVVALRGLAGTGKTTLIPALDTALRDAGMSVAIGAPTHRAAMILRTKGLRDADTLHALALTPYFQPVYACAMDYLSPWIDPETWEVDEEMFVQTFGAGRSQYLPHRCPTHEPYHAIEYCDSDGIPLLIATGLAKYNRTLRGLHDIATRYHEHGPRKALESLGVHGRYFFDGFGPKLGMGCLIIDEASMVDEETLALCSQAFPHICLIGDPGQLPPVKGKPVLANIDGVDLVDIHRQAGESPIVQLAYAARKGHVHWHQLPHKKEELEEWHAVEAQAFLQSPLIVWRNKTRINCTTAIREALGYPKDCVVPGEPLVCRSNSPADRVRGFFNNAIFHVVKVVSQDPLRAILAWDGKDDEDEGDEEDSDILQLHIEEMHGESVHPDAIPFRFGYCLTAHTAQGGEWPTVHIAKPDMLAYLGKCRSDGPAGIKEGNRWAYTAITRAKHTLGFLLNYTFTESRSLTRQEPPMPTMTATDDLSAVPVTGVPPTDTTPEDIPEPPLPMTMLAGMQKQRVHDPIVNPATPAGQVVMSVDEALYKVSQHAAQVLTAMQTSWEHALQTLNHHQHGFDALAAAVRDSTPCIPYGATVNVTTPAGYPMSISVHAVNQEEFVQKVGAIMTFLQDHQFAPGVAF